MSTEARRFAVQWGILAIEPDRLPLLVLHWLAGRRVPHLYDVDDNAQRTIWGEVPHLITPLQQRVARLSGAFQGGLEVISCHRIERAIGLHRTCGDYYWMALGEDDPTWLEERYDALHQELSLDDVGATIRVRIRQIS